MFYQTRLEAELGEKTLISDQLEVIGKQLNEVYLTADTKRNRTNDVRYIDVNKRIIETFNRINLSEGACILVNGFEDKALNDRLKKPFIDAGYEVVPLKERKNRVNELGFGDIDSDGWVVLVFFGILCTLIGIAGLNGVFYSKQIFSQVISWLACSALLPGLTGMLCPLLLLLPNKQIELKDFHIKW